MQTAIALSSLAFGLLVSLEAAIFAVIKLERRVEVILARRWWLFPPLAVGFMAVILGLLIGSASLAFALAHWALGA